MEDLFLAPGLDSQLFPPDLNAMSGLDGIVERLCPETPAELGLPDTTVAKEDHLHLILGLSPKVQFRKIGAQPWETVVTEFVRENLPRNADCLVGL